MTGFGSDFGSIGAGSGFSFLTASGGGGTGVIKVFGGGTLAGNRSPAPS